MPVSQESILVILHAIAALTGTVWLVLHFARGRAAEGSGDAVWWWLRWSAMATFLGCWAIATVSTAAGIPSRAPAAILFLTTVVCVTVACGNVWLIAWPSTRTGAVSVRARAALHTNSAVAVPAVFFAVASALFAEELGGDGRWFPNAYGLATLAAYGAVFGATLVLPRLVHAILRVRVASLVLGVALTLIVLYL